VAALLIPNTVVSYKSLSGVAVPAREEATIAPLFFEDRARARTEGDYGFFRIEKLLDQIE
jgi:hypothetical protein